MDGTGTEGCVLLGPLTGTPGTALTIYESAPVTTVGRLRLYGTFTNSLNIVLNSAAAPQGEATSLQFAPYNTNASQVYNGVISGDGQVMAHNSGGEVIFNNTNTFMGYQPYGTVYQPFGHNMSFVLSQGNVGIGTNSIAAGTNVVSGPLGTGTLILTVDTSATASSGSGTLFASGGARTLHNPMQYLQGTNMFTFRIGGSNNLTLAGGFELIAPSDGTFTNRIIEVDNTALTTMSGVIDDRGKGCPLTLTSTNAIGTLVLSATNTYTGPTTVSNGTLLVNGRIGTNGVAVTVAGGTLGGSGTVLGPVTVLPAGTLAPGTSSVIGTLTISNGLTLNGNLFFKVNKSLSPQSNDVASVSGILTNGGTGTLTVMNLGTALAVGDKFTLFNKALTNGVLLTVTGGGVTWNNNLVTDGSISVASTIVAKPVITGTVISGTNLVFSGNNGTGIASGTYYVLSSTNVAAPLSTWTPIFTNTFISGGAFSVTNPISPSVPDMFYILKLQ
jgi:autotransporter-associated beta strand protein